MRFVGIDHGTRAFRMAAIDSEHLPPPPAPGEHLYEKDPFRAASYMEFPREAGVADVAADEILADDIVVMSYSMGDAMTAFTPYDLLADHGVTTTAGAGHLVGEGSRLVDLVASIARSCHLAPGLHRGLPTIDTRFRTLYSHHGSGENLLAAFRALVTTNMSDLIISDISSNTVTLAVMDGRVVAGIDAAVGAPGVLQGPLDLEGIRRAERKGSTDAFDRGGVASKVSYSAMGRPEGDGEVQFRRGASLSPGRMDALSLAVAMEIKGLTVLGDFMAYILTGWAVEENPDLADAVAAHLGHPVKVLDRYAAAEGGALAALAVHGGAEELLGIPILR